MNEANLNKPTSVWSSSSSLPKFKKLNGNIKTDVLIIGGGIAGILCAFLLQQAGVDYTLVEATLIGDGTTKNTTAKITSQHGLLYHTLIKKLGTEKAQLYLHANQLAVEKYRTLCKNIDCDFEEKDSFVYSLDNHQKLTDELEALKKLHFPAKLIESLPLPFPVAGAIQFSKQAQFHPLKFLSEISKDLNIYENTRVKELIKNKAITDKGTISANKIIVATHFPFINKHGSYFLKMYQHRSYGLAFTHAPNLHGMYVDDAQIGMSFRNHDGMLLIGGGDHRTGKNGGNWSELRDFARRYYPEAREQYHWATQDCMTLDDVPYIGQYSKSTQNFYVATGFHKWGMTSAMVSAMILTDLVTEKESPFAEVFSPSRSMLRPQLAINAFEATKNLLTISKPRCPHMGCALKWNRTEHSWDCPCHGSRFSEHGSLIDNPSTGGIINPPKR